MTFPQPPLGTSAESTEEQGPQYSGSAGLIQLLNLLVRRAFSIVGVGLLVGLSVGFWTLSGPRTFTSKAVFVPQQAVQSGGLAGVAAQFGITMGRSQATETFYFWSELLNSDDLLRSIARHTHSVQTDSGRVTAAIADLYELDYPTEEYRLHEAVRVLRRISTITPSTATGMIQIEVTTKWPDFSTQIAQKYLDEVNRFNVQSRQSQAVAEREFAAERLEEATAELVSAEDALGEFLKANRLITNSPELTLESDRLARRIMILEQVVTSLSTAYQQSRLDAVRSTPVISIIDQPRAPAVGDARGTIRKTMVATSAGAIFMLIFFLVRERLVVLKQSGNPDLTELLAHLRTFSFRRRKDDA